MTSDVHKNNHSTKNNYEFIFINIVNNAPPSIATENDKHEKRMHTAKWPKDVMITTFYGML